MAPSRAYRDSTPPSTDNDLSSDTASEPGAGSDTDDDKPSRKTLAGGRHASSGSAYKKSHHDSSTTLTILLAFLVVAVAGIAAYYYYMNETANLGSSLENGSSGPAEAMTDSQVATDSRTQRTSSSTGTSESELPKGTSTGKNDQPQTPKETGTVGNTGSSTTSSKTVDPGSTSATNTAKPNTGASGPLRCKKGVGYNNATLTLSLDICWAYNWNSKGGGLKDGVMYVPMLWGPKQLDGWPAAAQAGIDSGATHLLGFNEPDIDEQAHLSPTKAAELWSSAIQPFATKNVKLVSPAVSNGVKTDDGRPMGVPWLLEFLTACDKCTIDAVALHWYDAATNMEYFKTYLEEAHTKLGKPIWLTEFMGTGTVEEQLPMIKTSVDWLEQQEYIEAYAAFGDFCDNPIANFVECTGNANELGKAYSDAG
ncbi:glycoside hydrolase family protein [Sporobolomyces koalae]|uniref:glycoside hydrolase family protein n=1 Tax=Sporobolomyces koalae TaxID=500713 RepID=UPI003175E5D2